jgi:hypothetical protein
LKSMGENLSPLNRLRLCLFCITCNLLQRFQKK